MLSKLTNPAPPPTTDDLLDVFRRVVPDHYYNALADQGDGTPHPSFALFRAIAAQHAVVAAKATRSVAARYYMPSAVQRDIPATSVRTATGSVTLRRVGSTDRALVIAPRAMRFDAGGGRRYWNAAPVVWNPGDTADRVAVIESEVPGFVGNLDHVANPDGSLDLDLITIADQDYGRSAPNGSLIGGAQIAAQDAGVPDLFAPEDVGLHIRINTSTNAALVGQVRRITGFDWPRLEIPPGSGRWPRRVFLEQFVRVNVVEAVLDDGGAATDYYAESASESGGTVPLLPAVPAVGDAFYFAHTAPFAGVVLGFDVPGEGDWSVVWEFWDGLAWVALDVADDTDGFAPGGAVPGEYAIQWVPPLAWAPAVSPSGSGLVLYMVRARVDAYTSVTTPPQAGRVVLLSPDGLDGFADAAESIQDDGGATTDYTTAASDNAIDDVPLLPAAPAVNDAFYIGAATPFGEAKVTITTPGAGTYALAWEYWNGLAWVSIPDVDDGSSRFTAGGGRVVRFTPPPDWSVSLSPGGSGAFLYFIRARVSSFTSITTQPLAARVQVAAIIDVGSLGWTLLDYQADGMGLEVVAATAPVGGRDNDLWLLGDDRGVYQMPGEPDDTFRDRASRLADVVSPAALVRTVNRILAPLGWSGKCQDVQLQGVGGGFTGLFCDVEPQLAPDIVGAVDLYGPGDLYPQNPWMVVQSGREAYGWYIVSVPYIGAGDFGIFCDDGPLYFDSVVGKYTGPALGGWCDGYPVEGYATYAAIHAALDAIDAGGVGFTLVRSENLTIP